MRKTLPPAVMRPLATALLCACAAFAFAQQPTPSPSPAAGQRRQPPPQPTPPAEVGDEEVVKITTNLVQLDAVVTDKSGKQVTDLRAEDFDILEDGKPQKITNFSYVSISSAPLTAPTNIAAARPDGPAPPAPSRVRREGVRRSIAVLVDDLMMSDDTIVPARAAVRNLVDEHLQQGDLVAIIRTGGEIGVLQQFTADRRLLYEAIAHLRPYLHGVGGMSAFAPVESDPLANSGGGLRVRTAPSSGVTPSPQGSRQLAANMHLLFALRNVIDGMRELPGRRSIVLFSPGFDLRPPMDVPARHLVDHANRASVVLYTVDPRGMVYTGPTASDPMNGLSGRQLSQMIGGRNDFLYATQGGLQYLSDETGGLSFKNSNDLAIGMGRIMEDLRGYYLIGYRPGGELFNRRFHTISARLRNRPDLHLRTRASFFGLTQEQTRPAAPNAADRIQLALASPFAAQQIGVRLTPIFNNLPGEGSFIRSMLHIDAGALTFTPEADGWQRAELVVHGALFGDNGVVAQEHRRTYTLRLRGETLRRAQEHGLDYVFNMPVKSPGAYQFRVVLLDSVSSHVGSAGQAVEVPEVKKDHLALSGIVLGGVASAGGAAAGAAARAQEGAVDAPDPEASSAVRRFRQGMFADYSYIVFNPRPDKASGRPQLSARIKLFRDGKLVFDGPETPLETATTHDPARVAGGGRLQLGNELSPGDYVLQLTVTDQLADPQRRTATQWIDFEIVK